MAKIDIGALERAVPGGVVQAGQEGYDEGRSVWNARFDSRPAAVARCRNGEDVAAVVRFVRDGDVPLAVKGGGHSNAGKSAAQGGVLLDCSLMKGVRVDTRGRTVLVEAGVRQREVDAAVQPHGLATAGGTCSSVGVAGLTLGGGSGYLSRKHGLVVDNLLAADVVTAEGRLVRASEDENADLFWAIRGGGGNFGVATAFEFRLHEVGPEVLAGQVMHRFDGAGDLLRHYRDYMAAAPESVQCYAAVLRVPPVDPFPRELHGHLALDFVVFNAETGAAGEAALRPLVEHGQPFLKAVGPQPYVAVQQTFDAGLPSGQRYDSRSHFFAHLDNSLIEVITSHAEGMVGPFTLAYLEPRGGAESRVGPSAMAYPHRDAAYGFQIQAGWTEPGQDEEILEWMTAFHAALEPHATGGVYVNLLGPGEDDRVPAAYGANYARLVELKTKWDPDNLFRANCNIPPKGSPGTRVLD